MPAGGRMQLKEIVRWNVRVSLLYAVGIWTMLGTYSFFHLKKKREPAPLGSRTQDSAATTYQEEYQEEISSEPQKQAPKEFVETKVVTKEGFVPLSSRIYKYGKSLFGVSPDTSIEK